MAPTMLSPREWQILQLLAEEKQNKEIAQDLGITVHTVEKHHTHIYEKLGLHNRTGALCWYWRNNYQDDTGNP